MATLTWSERGPCDVVAVNGLLKKGASPNAKNSDGNSLTALMVAAQNGCADIAKLLLDQGADVNAKAEHVSGVEAHVLTGITALSVACHSRDLAIVKMLVERGADIHALDSKHRTVLAFATTNEIAQFFLDHGLDINERDDDGYTLLIRSAGSPRFRPTVAFLLQHGADPHAKTKGGETALKVAEGLVAGLRRPDDVDLLKKASAKE